MSEQSNIWQQALAKQGQLLGQHEQVFQALFDPNKSLLQEVAKLSTDLPSLSAGLVSPVTLRAATSPPTPVPSPPFLSSGEINFFSRVL